MLTNVTNLLILNSDVQAVKKRQKFNKIIEGFYRDMALSYRDNPYGDKKENYDQAGLYERKAEAIAGCNKHWLFDVFFQQKIKLKKGSNRCNNKFCLNCQKVTQSLRRNRFEPVFIEKSAEYDFIHMVLTETNVLISNTNKLDAELDRMYLSCKRLIRYFSGNKKISGVDFSFLGYGGAVRSLEIGVSNKDYHPHFHCIVAVRKGLAEHPLFREYIKNKFSKKRNSPEITLFSEFEVRLQKMWYLMMNGIEVNAANIAACADGYSCQFKFIKDGNTNEIFKYITKIDEENFAITYKSFVWLDNALADRRLIQAYGCFHGLKIDDKEDETIYDKSFKKLIDVLQSKEMPVEVHESLYKIAFNMQASDFLYICAGKIHSIIKDMEATEAVDIDPVYTPDTMPDIIKFKNPEADLSPEQLTVWAYVKSIVLTDVTNHD